MELAWRSWCWGELRVPQEASGTGILTLPRCTAATLRGSQSLWEMLPLELSCWRPGRVLGVCSQNASYKLEAWNMKHFGLTPLGSPCPCYKCWGWEDSALWFQSEEDKSFSPPLVTLPSASLLHLSTCPLLEQKKGTECKNGKLWWKTLNAVYGHWLKIEIGFLTFLPFWVGADKDGGWGLD